MKLDLTKDEVNALYELGRYALRSRESQVDPEAQALVGAMRKIQKAAKSVMCAHCGERMASRRDRICSLCHDVRRKSGRLPANNTLRNRWLRNA